ncbi:uncharacterized protein LOC132265277 [Phlebotomus argentipes]|uniref:uncharacterized protein LOC132265277 n=1 Tax=Phlebotomus argentipes TaxID=94469 RepID=UPI002892C991|nr:uncharacterized protein LOC132265277 [Phlebotomus argentipes]
MSFAASSLFCIPSENFSPGTRLEASIKSSAPSDSFNRRRKITATFSTGLKDTWVHRTPADPSAAQRSLDYPELHTIELSVSCAVRRHWHGTSQRILLNCMLSTLPVSRIMHCKSGKPSLSSATSTSTTFLSKGSIRLEEQHYPEIMDLIAYDFPGSRQTAKLLPAPRQGGGADCRRRGRLRRCCSTS